MESRTLEAVMCKFEFYAQSLHAEMNERMLEEMRRLASDSSPADDEGTDDEGSASGDESESSQSSDSSDDSSDSSDEEEDTFEVPRRRQE